MLELHKKKAALPLSVEREKIEREIAVTDEKIDEIVYGFYGVTQVPFPLDLAALYSLD